MINGLVIFIGKSGSVPIPANWLPFFFPFPDARQEIVKLFFFCHPPQKFTRSSRTNSKRKHASPVMRAEVSIIPSIYLSFLSGSIFLQSLRRFDLLRFEIFKICSFLQMLRVITNNRNAYFLPFLFTFPPITNNFRNNSFNISIPISIIPTIPKHFDHKHFFSLQMSKSQILKLSFPSLKFYRIPLG